MVNDNNQTSNGVYKSLIEPLARDIKTFILDTLFPISCLACGTEGSFICVSCKMQLKTLDHQRCIVCQKPTPFGLTHFGCQTPHGADGLISFYDYHDDKLAKIIIAGKYNFIPETYKILGGMLASKIKNHHEHLLTTEFFLTSIPLHSSRKRWRGFNQAEVLCQKLSQELNIPYVHTLVRKKSTKTQKDLKKEQRIKNIESAFSLLPKFLNSKSEIINKNFILVDDVTTTGATLQEAAKVLKRNGAANVICLTIARD